MNSLMKKNVNIMLVSVLMLLMCSTVSALPSAYDSRVQGEVSPVFDQGNCDCCNAAATVALLEHTILANNGALYDLSEEQAKECPFEQVTQLRGGCSGGTDKMVINLFTKHGSLLEKYSSYRPRDSECNYISDPAIRVTDWHVLSYEHVPKPAVIKQAIIDNGAVYTPVNYYCIPERYDGRSVIYKDSDEWYGHGIIIVGWDDDYRHPNGKGVWIFKNSWGNKWGNNGYGLIAYGTGQIGIHASTIAGYELFDPNVRTLYHDDAGWTTELDSSIMHMWEMNVFDINRRDTIEKVEFWTPEATGNIHIHIYDDYKHDQCRYGKLLYKKENIDIDFGGYHSHDIPKTISSATGKVAVMVYIQKSFSAEKFVMPIDQMGPVSGESYTREGYCISDWKPLDFADATVRLRVRSVKSNVAKIVINGSSNIEVGSSTRFEANCFDSKGGYTYCDPVEWKNSDQTVGKISPDGVFTLNKKDETTTVWAICNGRVSNKIVMNSDESEPNPTSGPTPSPTSEPTPVPTPVPTHSRIGKITINSEDMDYDLEIGDSVKFTAECYDHTGKLTDGYINWFCLDRDVGVISRGGIFVANGCGTAKIVATSKDFVTGQMCRSNDRWIHVTEPQPVQTPNHITIHAGQSLQLTIVNEDDKYELVVEEVEPTATLTEAILMPGPGLASSIPVPDEPFAIVQGYETITDEVYDAAKSISSRVIKDGKEYEAIPKSILNDELQTYQHPYCPDDASLSIRYSKANQLRYKLHKEVPTIPVGLASGELTANGSSVKDIWLVFYNNEQSEFVHINSRNGDEIDSNDIKSISKIKI